MLAPFFTKMASPAYIMYSACRVFHRFGDPILFPTQHIHKIIMMRPHFKHRRLLQAFVFHKKQVGYLELPEQAIVIGKIIY